MDICAFARSTIAHNAMGGMEIHGYTLCKGLVESGHRVTVITTKHPEDILHEEIEGIEFYYLDGTTPGRYSGAWWIQSVRKFEELYKTKKFTLIWSQGMGGYGYLMRLRGIYPMPFVIISHGTCLSELRSKFNQIFSIRDLFGFLAKDIPKGLYFYFFLDRRCLHLADAIIAVSRELAENLQRGYLIESSKIFTVYNGVDVSKFKPSEDQRNLTRKRYGIGNDEKLLLTVGRILKQKGVHIAIWVLKMLRKSLRVKLMIVGDGPYVGELRKLAWKLGVSDYVIFCGPVPNDELPFYYNACDVFLDPTTRVEGFPIVIAEAMAVGRPIIASRIGGIPSAIDDGINGVLVGPGDVDEFFRKTLQVLSDTKLAERLSIRAREKALSKFSREKMIDETIRIFEEISERRWKGREV